MQTGGANATTRAAVLILLGGVWVTSCTEHSPSGPSRQSNLKAIVVISDPLGGALTTPYRSFPDGGSLDGSIAYISIPQGGVPDGVSVSIRNLRTKEMLTASLVEGGLDPIPIAAEAGDSIEIVVTVRDGTPLQAVVVVPRTVPPLWCAPRRRPGRRAYHST